MSNNLLLKWGTIKGWNIESEDSEIAELLKEYLKDSPLSCMADHPDKIRKELLCKIIDKIDGKITNDWTGKIMNKEEAKKYILEY